LSILFETMEAIIPVILENDRPERLQALDKSRLASVETDLKQYIVSIFVNSFADIPSNRRLDLFAKLIQLLGEARFLSVVTVHLMEQACLIKSKTLRTEREVYHSSLLALYGRFSSDVQLTSLCSLLCLFRSKFFDYHIKKKVLDKQLL